MGDDLVDLVDRSLRPATQREFDRRVDEQATRLVTALQTGQLDNPGFGVGLELEAYAVDDAGQLTRVPEAVFDGAGERELGVHNVEFNTAPSPFAGDAPVEQAAELRRQVHDARQRAATAGVDLVLDAMWTVPPSGGSHDYLAAVRERDGVTIAEHMTESARYTAIDNHILERAGGTVSLSLPGVDRAFPTILFESLTSSIQPHLQVPDASAFPRYYNVARGTLGPVLALATNSPLAPVDLYDVDDPYAVLEETHHELRVPVFEESINDAWAKVRVPGPIEATADTIDALVADPTCAPFLREWIADDDREQFTDHCWELDHKRGTYWRWQRAVIGGQPVGHGDQRSIRLEYRPLPTQPTIVDNIALQWLVAGLVRGLVAAEHPIERLDPDAAERGFYEAVSHSLDAELPWLTVDGERTTDSTIVFDEVFEFARKGLRDGDVPPSRIDEYLTPIEDRWRQRTSPSRWKLARVRDGLDAGLSFVDAAREMQATYVRRSASGTPFGQWS